MSERSSPAAEAFLTADEEALGRGLLETGWIVLEAESRVDLERIRTRAASLAAENLGLASPPSHGPDAFLDEIDRHVDVSRLNDLRLAVFRGLNAEPWLRPAYHRLARRALAALVGNELAMQRRVNLSIQLPGDDSSLLPLHADSWSGDSPFEIVLWVPLVDCHASKSLFILPRPEQDRLLTDELVAGAASVDDLYRAVEPSLQFLDLSYGQVLLFDQNLLHGNRINQESTTRWSLNCRFKGLFTPYADKKLGEFFEPITVRPMSRLGMAHRFPSGFGRES